MDKSLLIKNMVCDRCRSSVENILEDLGINFHSVQLGEVRLPQAISPAQSKKLAQRLKDEGFELLEDRESRMVNRIKSEVIRLVHHQDELNQRSLSGHLSVHLNKEYSSLSKLFSQVEGRTIENYFLEQRMERAKELLVYDELNLSQIADLLQYSSVAHLSAQFKKLTGMTPTAFKKLGTQGRKPLDQV